jgi:serine protease Do
MIAAAVLCTLAAASDPIETLQHRLDETLQRVLPAYVFFPGGSGFLISEDGYILTNHHVAGSRDRVQVILTDGRRVNVRRVCTDPVGDVALFKTPDGGPYPWVPLGDSDAAHEGEYVIAVGNPFGHGNLPDESGRYHPTVTVGIISAVGRRQGTYFDCIQTDAALNPGNSGGPLFNLRGEVLGINGRIATRFGARVNTGAGFAISANMIRRFLPRMQAGGQNGEVQHGWIAGLRFLRTPELGPGTRVVSVAAGSTAERAGIRANDRIVRVGPRPTPFGKRLEAALAAYPAGEEVEVVVLRGGEERTLRVVLDPWRESAGPDRARQPPPNSGYMGVTLDQNVDEPVIAEVYPNTPAATAGLQPGDLIERLNGVRVDTAEEFLDRLWQKRPGERITLTILRGEERREVTLTLGRRPRE